MNSAPRAAALLAAAACLTLSGCTSSPHRATDAAPAATPSTATATATPSTAAASATFRASARTGFSSCLGDLGRGPERAVFFQPTATADGDLTVTGADVVGKHVAVLHSQGVVVTTRRVGAIKGLLDVGADRPGGVTWPVTYDKSLTAHTAPASRTHLIGMKVSDGERIMPLLQLRVMPDAALRGIKLAYTDAGGHPGTVTLPAAAKFAATRCRR